MNPSDDLLVSTAIRGFAIFIAGWLVLLAMRRSSAATRHQVLLCMLAAAAIAPFANVIVPKWKIVPDWQPALQSIVPFSSSDEASEIRTDAPSPTRQAVPSSNTSNPASASADIPRFTLPPMERILTILWLCGVTILLARPLVGLLSLSLLRRRSHIADDDIVEITAELAARVGLKQVPSVRIAPAEIMPMAFGIFRHGVLLPASSVSWPDERLRIVLLHELTHLSRRDPAALLVSRIALAIHWFNPLAWLTARRLQTEQETACDDAVLFRGVTAPDYAGEVLAFSTGMMLPRFSAPVPTMARRGVLERRIVSILDTARNRRPLSPAAKFNITLLTALLGTPLVILGAEEIAARTASRGRILDRNGIVLAETTAANVRLHPYKAMAAHIVGFTDDRDPAAIRGKFGVESTFDETLRRRGDLKLTLDARIQSICEKTLRDAGIGRGCAIVLDPSNGDILASVSLPSFDPDQSLQHFSELSGDPYHPFWNRALTARPPGATFHLLTALAAARKDLIENTYECGPVDNGRFSILCWTQHANKGSHGNQTITEAFANLCGSHFNNLAIDTGIDELSATAGLLGLGQRTGVALPNEDPGLVGSRAYFESRSTDRNWEEETWRAETCYIGMGQGTTLATPLQIASLTATIANGGRVFTPRISLSTPVHVYSDLLANDIDEKEIELCRIGMRNTGQSSKFLNDGPIPMAGKSGTVQTVFNGKKSHVGWFTGYAPVDKPRHVVTVMIENAGSGTRTSGVVAKRILGALSKDLAPPVAFEAAKGHDNRIETIE